MRPFLGDGPESSAVVGCEMRTAVGCGRAKKAMGEESVWKCVDLCLAGELGDGVCVSIRGKRYVPLLTTQWRPSRRPSADTLQDSASWQTSHSVSSTLSSSSCLHQTSYTSKRMSGNSSNVSSALSNQTVVFSPLAQPQMASVFATPVCLTFVSPLIQVLTDNNRHGSLLSHRF